jgi:cis-3-alkyl-4-acyloxetan-2-one decarboxylase
MDDDSKQSPEIVDVCRDRHFSLLDSGEGETSLLLLHGIPGHRGAWDQVVDRLPASHRVLVPDLLGFGGSSRPNPGAALHAAAQAEALVALLDRLKIPRVIVVGHDFGGPVALWMTRIRPGLVTHLGLAASNAMPDTPIPFPLNLLKAPVLGGIVERATMSPTALRMMIGRGIGRPKVSIDRHAYVGDSGQARAIRSIFAMSLRNLRELYTPTKDALEALSIPTFVAWGDRDPFFAVKEGQRVADAVDGASFTVFDGAGHFLPEERPQELAELIAKLAGGRSDP